MRYFSAFQLVGVVALLLVRDLEYYRSQNFRIRPFFDVCYCWLPLGFRPFAWRGREPTCSPAAFLFFASPVFLTFAFFWKEKCSYIKNLKYFIWQKVCVFLPNMYNYKAGCKNFFVRDRLWNLAVILSNIFLNFATWWRHFTGQSITITFARNFGH